MGLSLDPRLPPQVLVLPPPTVWNVISVTTHFPNDSSKTLFSFSLETSPKQSLAGAPPRAANTVSMCFLKATLPRDVNRPVSRQSSVSLPC